ncbi:MAG: tyrosine-type recombinase/integrase [bacterium]|nr:tyrosine-type recombinase/integrase [bacterium]
MSNEEILETYMRGLSTGSTRGIYVRYATNFLAYADGNFSREKINGYMDYLRNSRSFSDGSVNFAFRVVRTMFSRNGIEWPFRRGEAPQIREDMILAPALHPKTVGRMITVVREKGEAEEKVFLALSTTYGLRRTEMVELTARDVRVKDQTIHIATAKHGRERTHLIPDAIVPFLAGYDFGKGRSKNYVFAIWYRMEHRIKMAHTEQVGWHSVRRSLNTMLLRVLPEATVMSFLRWKQRTSSHMPYRYSAQRFVGEEGETTEVVGDALDVDNQVFAVHPFLEFWG